METNSNDTETKQPASAGCHPTTSSESEPDCRRRSEAEKNALDLGHNVITHIDQLDGWRITGLRRWKGGVVQYTAFRKTGASAEQKIGYAKDEVFAHLQIPSQNASVEARK